MATSNTSTNLTMQEHAIDRSFRSTRLQQKPLVIWLTGLSGAGKSTVANALELYLAAQGKYTYLLDGDNVRHGLCRDLGFSVSDREENIRRVAEVARLFVDAGLIVITAFISPFARDRALARTLIGDELFIEVFVDAPLSECERRDPKGLYKKARNGLIKEFTGVGSAYEEPDSPDIRINTLSDSVEDVVKQIATFLDGRNEA